VTDLVLDIESRGGARIINFGMNEEEVRMAMQLSWVATASDGAARIPDQDQPHPRNYGTFSRKIGLYSLKEKVIPLAAAIRSSSGLPADILGLTDRGYLKPGLAADIAIFDPKSFSDTATYDHPARYSTGLKYVFVAGTPAIFEGTPTGALAGRALRRTSQ
jgi:N-acyl-D-aspartate/D-glutamate deacylase